MSEVEKERWWEERVESNLGIEWRTYLGSRSEFMKMSKNKAKVNWAEDGF